MTVERNRYFAGQLLREADLTQEQLYFRDKARRHNRMLHGWGIVCGLAVRPGSAGHELTVESGYALDPNGEEIVVPNDVIVDVRTEDDDGNAVSPCPQPGRRRVGTKRSPGKRLYLAIRYAECATSPVPAGENFEYSRTRESFAVNLLTHLPSSYRRSWPQGEPETHPCPVSPGEPWVILAEVALDSNLKVSHIDCHSHERRAAVL